MLYQLNYTHHIGKLRGKGARLKLVRSANVPVARLPDKVPSEEGEPLAKPDSRQGGPGRSILPRDPMEKGRAFWHA